MPEFIPVIVVSDSHFLVGLQTTVASAIVHETKYPLDIHLLDGGLSDGQWESLVTTALGLNPRTRLTRHPLTLSALTHFSVRNELTVMTYARILSPRFVPDPFAIYIDSDFLVSKPLSELLPYFHSDKAICATREGESDLTHDCPWGTGPELKKYGYVNSGLLVLNLDKWRKDHLTENLLTFLDKESARCLFFDQSAVNWLLRDDIDYLPSRWNVFGSDYDSGAIRAEPGEINLHFASGMKPWKRPLPTPSHHIWWLFNRIFPPATAPSNPVMQPRNLARYVSSWAQLRMSGNTNQIDTGATLKSWERFWRDRAARIE